MAKRIPPSVEFSKEFMSAVIEGNPVSCLIRQGARLMLQRALEEEISWFLGRGHYQRHNDRPFTGYRNGYEPMKLNMGEGQIILEQPQTRQTAKPFHSRILDGGCRSDLLEKLIPQLYIKGLSTRDIEDVLKETLKLNKVSRSVVSNLSKSIENDFNKWRCRDLTKLDILYLFIDGIWVALRQGTDEKEPVLVSYGITSAGNKVLLHIEAGNKESYDVAKTFIHNMKDRGLAEPLLVISDGNPGLKRAIRECFGNSFYQHCQVHKMRNILAKLPEEVKAQMKSLIGKAFKAKTYEEGLDKARAIIKEFKGRFTSAMECLEKDLEATLTCLKFPAVHRTRIRTTNLLERLFGEARRRTKVLGRFPTETSALKLIYAVLIDASKNWHGVKMTVEAMEELRKLWAEVRPGPNIITKAVTEKEAVLV
jgi:transposase-like protein